MATMTQTQSNIQLLRLTDVADRLNVSMPTVRRLVKDGKIRTLRVGRVLRVRPLDLESYIQSSIKVAGQATNLTGGGDQA